MRYDKEHKTHTRERIVRNASRKFRAEGLSSTGVAGVMKSSGLTVGGFYKHFRSKDELLAEAIAQGFSESDEKLLSALENFPPKDRWKEIVRWYLSTDHCERADTGCPVAALAPEISRAKSTVRKRIAGLINQRGAKWAEFMPGKTATEREQNCFLIFSAMVGAVSVARILTDPRDRERVLETMREYLLKSF
jgi:TetR/AcrR family transcriptional repressor of nem operon